MLIARAEDEAVDDIDSAGGRKWWRELGMPVVVKHDGLAAGKGVIVPADAAETIRAITTTALLGPYVLEARMTGPEC